MRYAYGENLDNNISDGSLMQLENMILNSKNNEMLTISRKTLAKLTHHYRLHNNMLENFFINEFLQGRI